jgi:hypothetical protein
MEHEKQQSDDDALYVKAWQSRLTFGGPPPRISPPPEPSSLTPEEQRAADEKMELFRSND